MMEPSPINLLALSKKELETLVVHWGWPRYRAAQLWHWLYRQRVTAVDAMTNLSRDEQQQLSHRTMTALPRVIRKEVDADGTRKLLLEMEDRERVETVLIPDGHRLTLCMSTQVGCTFDCGFCLTGTMGLRRNLRADEIVGQWFAARDAIDHEPFEHVQRLTNLVFMGMGEPLANFSQLIEALSRLTDQQGIAFPARRITVSTVGMIPQMAELGQFRPPVNLAVSLNATTDAVRTRLMPMASRSSIEQLMEACRAYPHPPRRWITFEYVLLEGINDTADDARRLVQLLRGIRCKINLIPWNGFEQGLYRRPSTDRTLVFQSILVAHRLPTYIRKSKGQTILAACGQLHSVAVLPEERANGSRHPTLSASLEMAVIPHDH